MHQNEDTCYLFAKLLMIDWSKIKTKQFREWFKRIKEKNMEFPWKKEGGGGGGGGVKP